MYPQRKPSGAKPRFRASVPKGVLGSGRLSGGRDADAQVQWTKMLSKARQADSRNMEDDSTSAEDHVDYVVPRKRTRQRSFFVVKKEQGASSDPDPDPERAGQIYCCEACFMTFSCQTDLMIHHSKMHQQRGCAVWRNVAAWSRCHMCPATFRSRKALDEHKQQEHGVHVRWHHCRMCDHRTKRKGHLREHMAHVHGIGVRLFPCDRCTQTFKKKGDRSKHMASIHGVGVKWFSCYECGMKFLRSGHLREHQQVHVRDELLSHGMHELAKAFTPASRLGKASVVEVQPATPWAQQPTAQKQPPTPSCQPRTPMFDGPIESI